MTIVRGEDLRQHKKYLAHVCALGNRLVLVNEPVLEESSNCVKNGDKCNNLLHE